MYNSSSKAFLFYKRLFFFYFFFYNDKYDNVPTREFAESISLKRIFESPKSIRIKSPLSATKIFFSFISR